MKLEEIVPLGRSFDEYRRMFALTDRDLELNILSCADGPAGFNGAMFAQGGRAVSVDPLYQYTVEQIRERISTTFPGVLDQVRANEPDYVWDTIPSVEALARCRMAAMEEFLQDFERGKAAGRYLPAELPELPFADGQFDLALCSHFLFLYSGHLSAAFHVRAVKEMCRVAREVRIFPLLDLAGRPSTHVDVVCEALSLTGHICEIGPVSYEFQRGANRMLRVTRRSGMGTQSASLPATMVPSTRSSPE